MYSIACNCLTLQLKGADYCSAEAISCEMQACPTVVRSVKKASVWTPPIHVPAETSGTLPLTCITNATCLAYMLKNMQPYLRLTACRAS